EFTFDDAVRTLKKNERYTGQILSKLIEAGWMEKQRDSSDKRKKIYNIVNFEKVIKELGDAAIEKQ
ncbi:MAG: hypothetical protein LUQ07_01450, partial [Methanospirillum sp.]|nr:hypothetical protein [Methanospirillum sp.]